MIDRDAQPTHSQTTTLEHLPLTHTQKPAASQAPTAAEQPPPPLIADGAAAPPPTTTTTTAAPGGETAAIPAAIADRPPSGGRSRGVCFDLPPPANDPEASAAALAPPPPPPPLPPVATAAPAHAAAAAATATAAAAAASTPTSSSAATHESDTFSPLSPQIEILRAARQQRLRDRRGPAATAAHAAAQQQQQHQALPPGAAPPSSARVPRGGCLNALQAGLDAARAPRVVEVVRTRAAGVKHIGFGPFKRENQDEFAISLGQGFGGAPGGNLFCVFDGHGAAGKDAAAYARQQLPLLLDAEMRAHAARAGPDGGGEAALKGAVEVMLAEAFSGAERALQRAGVNLASSGTTATVVYQRGSRLWVASAGDSRVVLCSRVDAAAAIGGEGGGGGGGGAAEGVDGSALAAAAAAAANSSSSKSQAHHKQQQQQQQQMSAAADAVFSAVSAGGVVDPALLGNGASGGGGGAPGGRPNNSNNPTADADGAGVAGPPRRLRGAPGVWRAQPLTIDHRPRRASERARVEAAGGRVAPKRLPSGRAVGEPRLWLADLPSPGLLLSRSLGDLMAASVGCTSDPEVTYVALRPGVDRYMVIASDGVWDVLGNAQVCELVVASAAGGGGGGGAGGGERGGEGGAAGGGGGGGPPAACRRVLDAALGEWEERMSADNVTVVVVEFDWGDM